MPAACPRLTVMATPRRGIVEFSLADLIEVLEPYARLKEPPFGDWEMDGYGKKRRSQGPDRQGLAKYHALLKSLLLVCPSARPGHVRLREVFLELHRRFAIMHPDLKSIGKDLNTWSDDCADRLKLMCRHLLDIKDSKTSFLGPQVKELVGMIVEPEDTSHEPLQAIMAPSAGTCACRG